MLKAPVLVFAVGCALAAPLPTLAQDSELARVREEMKALQKGYEERMQALEKRLSDAEARTRKVEAGPAQPAAAAPAQAQAQAAGARGLASAFNPSISLILQGTYARTSKDPTNFVIGGFLPS